MWVIKGSVRWIYKREGRAKTNEEYVKSLKHDWDVILIETYKLINEKREANWDNYIAYQKSRWLPWFINN